MQYVKHKPPIAAFINRNPLIKTNDTHENIYKIITHTTHTASLKLMATVLTALFILRVTTQNPDSFHAVVRQAVTLLQPGKKNIKLCLTEHSMDSRVTSPYTGYNHNHDKSQVTLRLG